MTTITPDDFRQIYPEFDNKTDYPDRAIQWWMADFGTTYSACFCGFQNETDKAMLLYTAFNLVIAKKRADAANNGGVPGEMKGPVSSRSVDKVSNGYDTGALAPRTATYWNANDYGAQFYQLLVRRSLGLRYRPGAGSQQFVDYPAAPYGYPFYPWQ